MIRIAPLWLGFALVLCGCNGLAAPRIPGAGALPQLGSPLADGLPAPEGAGLREAPQPSPEAALAAASLFTGTAQRTEQVRTLLGFEELGEGTFYAVEGAGGPLPRVSVAYAPVRPAKSPTLFAALSVEPQPARLPKWLGHPDCAGYLYANDLLALTDGLDRFLTSEELSQEMALGGPMQEGMLALISDLYTLSFADDLASWWTGELCTLWLREPSGRLEPVILVGTRKASVAADKIRQILAMYYFNQHGDRGVFASDSAGGQPVERLRSYTRRTTSVDQALAIGNRWAAIGSMTSLTQLFEPAGAGPAGAFAWDAVTLSASPRSLALGFDGSRRAADALEPLFEGAFGMMPGVGRSGAEALSGLFDQPGEHRLYIALESARLQWWLMGPAAANPSELSTWWNGAQAAIVLGVAGMPGWERREVIVETGEEAEVEPWEERRERRRDRRPFWRR